MKKWIWASLAVLVVAAFLSSCFPTTPQQEQPKEYEKGYYVIFNFQFKKADNPDLKDGEILLNEALKMTEKDGEYVLEIKKADLKDFIAGHDKDGVYWWNVVEVTDATDTSKWVVYGGTCDLCPSVPFLKEDFDTLADDATVAFYAKIPEDPNSIVGLGDNVKDGKTFYVVGPKDFNTWTELKDEDGDGVFEGDVDVNLLREVPFKITPVNNWSDKNTDKALYFNGKNYYAAGMGDEGKITFDATYATVVHVKFDVHHSVVEITPKEGYPTIKSVKEKVIEDTSTEIEVPGLLGVVTYVYKDYVMLQDDTDAIEVYKKSSMGGFEIGDSVLFKGGLVEYYEEKNIIELTSFDASEVIDKTFEVKPKDITGYNLDGEATPSELYGKLVTFKGVFESADKYGNAFFDSEGASITVKNYVGYDFQTGVEYQITGVIMWNYDRYKVVPRIADDIVVNTTPIRLDGKLSDWESLADTENFVLISDATDDYAWDGNDIKEIGMLYDSTNSILYLVGVFKKGGTNDLMLMIGATPTTGGTDNTYNHSWGRRYKTENEVINGVLETWENGFDAWTISSGGTFTEIKDAISSAYGTTDDGYVVAEFAYKINPDDLTGIDKLWIAAALTGGYDSGNNKQWLSDVAPDQPDLVTKDSDGGFTAPATISNFEYLDLK